MHVLWIRERFAMSEPYTGSGMSRQEAIRFILRMLKEAPDTAPVLHDKAEQQAMEHEITAFELLKASRPW
jgi:hypothetical protein